jgi:hypothetical protein
MADLIGSIEEPEICFGEHRPSVVLESGQIWMDQALPLREGAARLAHLQRHIQVPTLVPGEDCLDRALEREVEALEIELQWRLDLAVNSAFWTYEFEEQWRESKDPEGILRFIWAHPDGGGGIPPLLRDYLTRCEAGRTE